MKVNMKTITPQSVNFEAKGAGLNQTSQIGNVLRSQTPTFDKGIH